MSSFSAALLPGVEMGLRCFVFSRILLLGMVFESEFPHVWFPDNCFFLPDAPVPSSLVPRTAPASRSCSVPNDCHGNW